MRLFSTLFLILCFATLVTAQQTKRTFLGKSEMAWMDKEVLNLSETLGDITTAFEAEDSKVINAKRGKTKLYINRLATNSSKMLFKIEEFITADEKEFKKEYISDEPRNRTYTSKVMNPRMVELVFYNKDLQKLKENIGKIQILQSEIEKANFEWHSYEENSSSNIEKANKLLTLAQETNQIFQNSKVN